MVKLNNHPEKTPAPTLERFKRQNKILKKFGRDGLRIFKLIDGERTWSQILDESGVEEDVFSEFVEWVLKQGYVVEKEEELATEESESVKEVEEESEEPVISINPFEEEVEEEKQEESNEENEVVKELEEVNENERIVREKYGELGVKVYHLIDGQKNAREIMDELGIDSKTLLEMLEFMERKGIIKLKHVESKTQTYSEEEVYGKDLFSPLIAEKPVPEVVVVDNPVELPSKKVSGFMKEMVVKTKLMVNFGSEGVKVWNSIDGKKTTVDIASSLKLPIYDVTAIVHFLYDNNAVELHVLTRDEILARYGDEAYAIYKKYGCQGLMLYEIIDYNLPLSQIAKLTTPKKEKFVEMLFFVHKVLGVDIPLDKELILKKL